MFQGKFVLFARLPSSRASFIAFNWVLITISVSPAPFSPWEGSVQVVGTGVQWGRIPRVPLQFQRQPGMLTFWMSPVKPLEYLNICGDRGMGMFLPLSDQD